MVEYYLTAEEDLKLYNIVPYCKGRTLYERLVEMPLEDLNNYPQKGYRWWMGRKAKSPIALELRDYILHWRIFALDFREKYPRSYLASLSTEDLTRFLKTYITKTPLWAYEGPTKDAARFLFFRSSG